MVRPESGDQRTKAQASEEIAPSAFRVESVLRAGATLAVVATQASAATRGTLCSPNRAVE